jgi:hypothetical protein
MVFKVQVGPRQSCSIDGLVNCPISEPFFDLNQIRTSSARAIVNSVRSKAMTGFQP